MNNVNDLIHQGLKQTAGGKPVQMVMAAPINDQQMMILIAAIMYQPNDTPTDTMRRGIELWSEMIAQTTDGITIPTAVEKARQQHERKKLLTP